MIANTLVCPNDPHGQWNAVTSRYVGGELEARTARIRERGLQALQLSVRALAS